MLLASISLFDVLFAYRRREAMHDFCLRPEGRIKLVQGTSFDLVTLLGNQLDVVDPIVGPFTTVLRFLPGNPSEYVVVEQSKSFIVYIIVLDLLVNSHGDDCVDGY